MENLGKPEGWAQQLQPLLTPEKPLPAPTKPC